MPQYTRPYKFHYHIHKLLETHYYWKRNASHVEQPSSSSGEREKQQGPVVRRPISANPGLNFNLGFLIPLLKSLFGIIFSVLFKVSNSHTLD